MTLDVLNCCCYLSITYAQREIKLSARITLCYVRRRSEYLQMKRKNNREGNEKRKREKDDKKNKKNCEVRLSVVCCKGSAYVWVLLRTP